MLLTKQAPHLPDWCFIRLFCFLCLFVLAFLTFATRPRVLPPIFELLRTAQTLCLESHDPLLFGTSKKRNNDMEQIGRSERSKAKQGKRTQAIASRLEAIPTRYCFGGDLSLQLKTMCFSI